MRKILAIAVLAGGLMIPLATPSAAVTVGLPCQNDSIEGFMCGIQYDDDLTACELGPEGQQAGCRATAMGNFARCMNTC
ncbi:MAG: hypothetical protein EON87_07335 [Brevundimonas sp.]|nr:MAG: hypothetical protein EON87_07335 [Brevundimonas sp.]